MKPTGKSSPFTKLTETPCFDCSKGTIRPQVVSRNYTVEGKSVRVPGLVVLKCDTCGQRSWPASEIEQGRHQARCRCLSCSTVSQLFGTRSRLPLVETGSARPPRCSRSRIVPLPGGRSRPPARPGLRAGPGPLGGPPSTADGPRHVPVCLLLAVAVNRGRDSVSTICGVEGDVEADDPLGHAGCCRNRRARPGCSAALGLAA